MSTDDRSRTARRRDERALLDERRELLDALAALPPEARAALPADAELLGVIEQLADMRADGARRRLIRHYARRTPDAAWPPLEDALERLSGVPPAEIVTEEDRAAADWAERLIAEGDAALAEFLDAHVAFDRSRLRQLVRNAARREGHAAERARGALEEAIKRASPTD